MRKRAEKCLEVFLGSHSNAAYILSANLSNASQKNEHIRLHFEIIKDQVKKLGARHKFSFAASRWVNSNRVFPL